MQVSKDALFSASSPFFLEDLTLIPSAQRFRQQHVKFSTKLYLTQQKCASASLCCAEQQQPCAVMCSAEEDSRRLQCHALPPMLGLPCNKAT